MRSAKIAVRPALAVAVLGFGALLTGCGGGGDSNGGNDTLPTRPLENVAQTPSPTPALEAVIIKVTDNAFDPAEVTVKKGTPIIWQFEGSNPHSIQMAGTTTAQQTSGTFERVMDQPGNFAYQCGVHGAAMPGRITVQ